MIESPLYNKLDLSALDNLYEVAGLSEEWMKSERRVELQWQNSLLAQAARYGAQIRQLEDQGFDRDYVTKIKEAWVAFLSQIKERRYLYNLVSVAYYKEYSK